MENCIMANMILAITEEMAFGVFSFAAIVCLGLSFVIVCLVHPLGNKLLLLGILIALTSYVFAANEPSAGTELPIIMMVIGCILVLAGTVCSIISHFSRPKLFTSAPETDE